MALFTVTHDSPLSADEAWARLTDWPAHGTCVPFTSVRVTTDGPSGVGTVFVARTGVGPASFDDPMEIVSWTPPAPGSAGRARIEKRGGVMTGWAELTVAPRESGSRSTWREDVSVAHTPAFASGLTKLSSRLLFGRVLRKLLTTP